MFLRRGRIARRKPGQALVPVEGGRLPTIYLGSSTKTKRERPAVYLCDGQDGASGRLKWLASTCVAGMVGVCLIGVAIFASMNMSDGNGMVSSIKRASLAAMKPMRGATLARDGQSATTEKGDRIQLTTAGFTTRDVIHETVVEHQGSREYITIKPYLRVVAGFATSQPNDAADLPPFNPFKLYSDSTPIGSDGAASPDAPQAVNVSFLDLPNGALPQEDGVELKPDEINELVAEAAENFAYAAMPQGANEVTGSLLQPAAYRQAAGGASPSPLAPNITVIHKLVDDPDDDDEVDANFADGAETKTVKVGRGDTLMSIVMKVGAETSQAKIIVDALEPAFPAQDLKPGQEIRFTLVPAPSDTDDMEPARVSVFAPGGEHLGSVTRTNRGDFVVTDQVGAAPAQGPKQQRATLYTSFYHAAMIQHIPADTILKLLRVHSYDVDFKQKVKPGDGFDVFFDMPETADNRDEMGEVLFTSMTIDGQTRSFYRFRSPDGLVDYYDPQGNSAKKFLMRNPVKGGRYTSGFGARRHPLLRVTRMHTGVDWAAPSGTPILAGADGTVESVGREGGYGNHIRIRHANGFATAYGHLSRYAAGLEPGIQVKQGQVIGYVGSTGLSSGPHCHYEILVNNKYVNPMTIQVPRGLQLTGRQLAEFQKERGRIDELRQMDPVTSRVAQASQ
ncbi:MAG: peptidoglycan DD-metalloendopeptidase family protein [Methyloceanibacter sp.]|nr:peptidoglycan DD-metalloendopeptidase family protein [Acidobacteriota bacterium]